MRLFNEARIQTYPVRGKKNSISPDSYAFWAKGANMAGWLSHNSLGIEAGNQQENHVWCMNWTPQRITRQCRQHILGVCKYEFRRRSVYLDFMAELFSDKKVEGSFQFEDIEVIPTITLSPPRMINYRFPLQPQQKYYITQYEELGFSYSDQTRLYTIDFLYPTCTFLFLNVGRMYFLDLVVEGLNVLTFS